MKLELIQISKKDFEDLTSTHIDTRSIAKFENEKLETTAVITFGIDQTKEPLNEILGITYFFDLCYCLNILWCRRVVTIV